MIRHRFDRSSMAYRARLGINKRRRRRDPATSPHEKHASDYPRVCVGVASLRPRRRMFHKTRPSEARLKPPPAQRHSFSPGLPRAPPPSFPQRRRYGQHATHRHDADAAPEAAPSSSVVHL